MRAPHWERKPPVTLRKITLGRRARSHSLLVAGTSRRVMKTKRSPRHLRIPRASCWPVSVVGLTASNRSSLRSRSARYWTRVGTAATNGNGALQQLVKARSEAGVSGVDGVLGVAQQVGEAQLALVSMPGLSGIAVGNPDIGLGLAKEIGQHRGAAAVGDQMVDGGGREQHPLPPVFPLDTRRGLVRGHNLAAANFCGGDRGGSHKRSSGAGQHIGNRALADADTEQFVEQ